jgi:hypothetical protein
MDDDRILALKIEDPDLKESAVRRGADEHRELVSDVLADRVRIACSMSSSEAPCLRAGSPILT